MLLFNKRTLFFRMLIVVCFTSFCFVLQVKADGEFEVENTVNENAEILQVERPAPVQLELAALSQQPPSEQINTESESFAAENYSDPPVAKKQVVRKVYDHQRGRNEFSLSLDANHFYGFTDNYQLFYTIPTTNINHMGYGVRFGLEGVLHNGFGVRLLAGCQRIFYADQGAQQINKNYLTLEMPFSYYFRKNMKKFDPYVSVGPTVIISTSGQQGFLAVGFGIRHFFNDNWSARIEPVLLTDFDGIRVQLHAGLGLHF